MMDNNLKGYIDDFFSDLNLYDDYVNEHEYKVILKASIDEFLDNPTQYNAFNVYEIFLMIYQITSRDKSYEKEYFINEPNIPLDFARVMFEYENSLNSNHKNVFLHSVEVFILGLAIYSQNEEYRRKFGSYVMNSSYEKYYAINHNLSNEEFLYRWGLAALFYDILLPMNFANSSLNNLSNEINSAFKNKQEIIHFDLSYLEELDSIQMLYPYDFADQYRETHIQAKKINLYKPTDIMAHKLSYNFKFDLREDKMLIKSLNSFFSYMEENNFIAFGFLSSIIILDLYAYLIQHYQKNYDFFFYPIVDSSTAILLHNYYNKILQREPFKLGPLNARSHPIAFLLILCDELLIWNGQPSNGSEEQKYSGNDFKIEIGHRALDVEYVFNKESLGINPDDIKMFIYSILDIESVFRRGLFIQMSVLNAGHEQSILDIDNMPVQNLSIGIVERLAREIHQQHIDNFLRGYEGEKTISKIDEKTIENHDLKSFDGLPSHVKMDYVQKARSISRKLNILGYEIANSYDERRPIVEFLEEDILDLAIFEHKEWCEEKLSQGWSYGYNRDDSKLIHNYLVPWHDLTDEVHQQYLDSIRNIPKIVNSIDLKVVPSKIRLLTFEMHKFYLMSNGEDVDGYSSEILFNQLDSSIQYSNYKQTDSIVEILKKRSFVLANINDRRDGIKEFSWNYLEDFARMEHEKWCELKFKLGWRYGHNGEDKTSPNLVPWYDLDDNIKDANKQTFINLPRICEKVGLKIVKIY